MLTLKQITCTHEHIYFCDTQHYRCDNCNRVFDIPRELYEASGIYARIAKWGEETLENEENNNES